MFFLPGTSFAVRSPIAPQHVSFSHANFCPQAFLAMPFFATSHYLSNAAKVWIWVVCTVPSTIVAFTFYFYWKRRDKQARRTSLNSDSNEWHGMSR